MPVGNDEEIRRALVLREVLDKILQLEKTSCPFERSFTVELPERPKTPVKKRPWTPTAPTRSVSMNWPPGQPVTPPPEFPTRGRFYNPSARRFSDFGVDTSKTKSILGTPPQKSETQENQREGEKASDTPPRRVRVEAAAMILEEPELLSPPPTAMPLSIPEVTKEAIPQLPITTASEEKKETVEKPAVSIPTQSTTAIPVRPREPIWITKKVPSSANRKAKRVAPTQGQSIETKTSAAKQPKTSLPLPQTAPTPVSSQKGTESESSAPVSKTPSLNDSTDESETKSGELEGSGQLRVRRTRVAAFASRRAATAPPLRLRTSSTSTSSSTSIAKPEKVTETEIPEPDSPAESSDSFHSVESHQSWHSPISPSLDLPVSSPTKTYPYPHDNIPLAPHLRKGQMSDFTTTPTASGWEKSSIGAVVGSGANTPNTPFTEIHEEESELSEKDEHGLKSPKSAIEASTTASPVLETEDATDSPSETSSVTSSWSSAASWNSTRSNTPMRHRAATTSVAISHTSPRALSPLPPAANLLLADPVGRASTAVRAIRRIPSSIFNKTCEILISPPAHLISLMLKAAARITAGEWRGFVFGMDEGGELVDIRWDWSDDGDIDGLMLEGWEESDFDFSSIQRRNSTARKPRASFSLAPADHLSPKARLKTEYQDPWASPPDEPDLDEQEEWSRSWGVD